MIFKQGIKNEGEETRHRPAPRGSVTLKIAVFKGFCPPEMLTISARKVVKR